MYFSVRWQRLLGVIGVTILLLTILAFDGRSVAQEHLAHPSATLPQSYALQVLSTLLFLAVGSLVWLYAEARKQAALLFGFCCSLALASGSLIGVAVGNRALDALSSICSALAVFLLLLFLLRFPSDIFAHLSHSQSAVCVFWTALTIESSLCAITIVNICSIDLFQAKLPPWLYILGPIYYLVSTLSLFPPLISALRAHDIRIQQQARFFLIGIILSFLPICGLTVLPTLLHLPYIVDGRFSMLFLLAFPLAMGYALLRYQVLLLEQYMRRIVHLVIGIISLALVTYLFIVGSQMLFGVQNLLFYVTITLGVASVSWWIVRYGQQITDRLFFSEFRYYQSLVDALPMQLSTDLSLIAQGLCAAAQDTLATPAAILFIPDEQCQHYRPVLLPNMVEAYQAQALLSAVSFLWAEEKQDKRARALLEYVGHARRPMLLAQGLASIPIADHLHALAQKAARPLLVPLRSEGHMIALLVLQERDERYAGLELSVLDLLIARFLPLVQTALLTRSVAAKNAELEQVNAQLCTANTHLLELDKLKDQFIVTTLHELRTPLTYIQGFLLLLDEHYESLSPEAARDFLRKATIGAEELTSQMDAIYSAGRLNFETSHLEMETFVLADLMQQVADMLLAQMLREQRVLNMNIDPGIEVFANARHVRDVFLNFTSNAFKYSEQGTPVTISAHPIADSVLITVEDRGLGVPEDARDLLFERFVRLERDLNSPRRGAGLGLSICKHLVEAMGGKIWVESSGIAGEGSRFCFTLQASVGKITQDSIKRAS